MLMKIFLILMLGFESIQTFELPLPGGRKISFNGDTGVLRIQLDQNANNRKYKIPEKGTKPSTNIINSIQVKYTGIEAKGYGAYATKLIETDAFLGFYEGDIISSREALDFRIEERKRDLKKKININNSNDDRSIQMNAMDYVMSLDGGVTFIDGYLRAQDKSSFSTVHLNHADKETEACNVIRLLEDDGRVAFFTSREINIDEELCFDYGKQFWIGREHLKI